MLEVGEVSKMVNRNAIPTLPAPISHLKLDRSLKNCGRTRVSQAYQSCNAPTIWAYDQDTAPASWSASVSEEQKKRSLEITNPSGQEVVLVPLDRCVITGQKYIQGGVADCLLLTGKAFCLVEFKTNAYDPNRLSDRISDGSRQLWHTYDGVIHPCCKSSGIAIEKVVSEITFQIVLSEMMQLTMASATIQDTQFEFFTEHGILLFVSRQKTFG